MDEKKFVDWLTARFKSHGLMAQGWTFEIELDVDHFGYTNFETKVITISRYEWPTTERNMKEVALHEIAHALCGHGRHDLEWWDKLVDIGGRGVWVWDHNGSVSMAKITD